MRCKTMKSLSKPSRHLKMNHLKKVSICISLTLLVIAAFFLSCKEEKVVDKKSLAIPPNVEQVKKELNGLDIIIQKKENEILKLIAQYEAQTGKKFPIAEIFNIGNLGKKEREVLEEYIRTARDISIKTLLQELVKKDDEIRELQETQKTLNEQHKPHVVKGGENHHQIALDYLLFDRGLDKKEAKKLLDKALLFDPLTPGFKVWNFYDGKEYSSFITQGDASISPAELERKRKEDFDKIIAEERIKFEEKKEELETITREFHYAQRDKQKELDAANKKIRQMAEQNKQLEQQLNSLYYLVDTEINLKKSGIIYGGFLKPDKRIAMNPIDFRSSIDLRENKNINIYADQLGLKKIKKVIVFPTYYTKGLDFKIEISQDKQESVVTILKEEKFKKQFLVIAVQ